VAVVQLDNLGNVISGNQALAPGNSVFVTLGSSNTGVGTITPSVTFNAGDLNKNVTFTAAVTGNVNQASTTLTATGPNPYVVPASNQNAVIANVSGVGCSLSNVTVGQNLEATTNVKLTGQASSGLSITVSSMDTSKFTVACTVGSPNCTGTTPNGAGTSSITVNVPSGASNSVNFYVYGVSAGSGAIAASCGAFGSDSKTITVGPSGFLISGPAGFGAPVLAGIGPATASSLAISPALLDSNLNPARDGQGNVILQPIAGGLSSNPQVSLTSTDIAPASGVGSISPTSVTFVAGQTNASALFTGSAAGQARLAALVPATPTGFSTPSQFSTVTATVQQARMFTCGDGTILGGQALQLGQNLEVPCQIQLSQAAPVSVTVTISTSSNQLLISTDKALAGTSSINVVIPAGSSLSSAFYLQGAGNNTSPSYTATASGYPTATGNVNLTPSSIALLGPNGTTNVNVSQSNGPVNLSVILFQVDNSQPGGFGQNQMLAGGLTLALTISDDSTVGTVTSPTVHAGDSGAVPVFTPLASGIGRSTQVTLATPANFTTSAFSVVQINVFQ
jgi:hypothetical protein